MRRISVVLVVLACVSAVILVLALRHKELAPAAGVATLLPADTALLIHVPDLEATRAAWQRTDLYQLYHEPAMQEFLRKPRMQLPNGGPFGDAWHDAAALRIRDAFVATSTIDSLRLTAGFEFRCGEAEAREVVERWTQRAVENGAQRSAVQHGKYAIEVLSAPRFTVASVMVDHRFLAATSADDLKAMLDRIDAHAKENRLNGDKNFRAALRQMPREYAALIYFQPKTLAQKLTTLRVQSGRQLPASQQTLLERIESISHAVVFEGGKLRDIDFVAMPRVVDAKLTRDTLAGASAETLLYLAAITNLREQLAEAAAAPDSVLARAGVSRADCQSAFGDEMSLLADWPANASMPGAVATLSLRDGARAKKVAAGIAGAFGWESLSSNGAQFFTAPASGLAFMRLAAGLSDKRLAIGASTERVQRALASTKDSGGLESAPAFREASRLVPEGDQFFAWLDLGALYRRLDTAVRPILQLSAALMPDASDRFDVSKLPPADIVTKHLSPIVASQSYVEGGYRSESVGTITLSQAMVLGAGGYAMSAAYGKHSGLPSWLSIGPRSQQPPISSPTASPSP